MRTMRRHGFPFLVTVAVAGALAGLAGCKASQKAVPEPMAQAVETEAPGAPQAAGKVACEVPVHDYGTVLMGEQVKHTFTLKNVGDGVLRILSARGG